MISFGFSARHWQQIEAGRPITLTTLLRICSVFRVPAYKVIKGIDEEFTPHGPDLELNYAVLSRLLSGEDIEFLRTLPGYKPAIECKLRKARRRIFRLYLKEMVLITAKYFGWSGRGGAPL